MTRALYPLLICALGVIAPGCSTGQANTQTVAPAHEKVRWSAWEKQTFETAKRERRILLINVAASWCHWCHVMDEKTYGNPEVAALLAKHFMPIRIDSDARPDLAERYLDWGWPATAVLTSDAQPVLELRGYQSPESFLKLLRELVEAQQKGELTGRRAPPPAAPPDQSLAQVHERARKQLDRYYDDQQHGWGGPKKYPLAPAIEYSLMRGALQGDAAARDKAVESLRREMLLLDPVWGGTYQYSVGNVWTKPHYEKLGAHQAGSLESYVGAFLATGDPEFKRGIEAQANYILEFLQDPNGGFYTSQDADLRLPDHSSIVGAEYYAKSDAQRRALGIPRIDTAIYADINGALIHALCQLAALEPDGPARAAARRATERIINEHSTPGGGLTHQAGGPPQPLYLRDQANMGRALVALYQVTGEGQFLEQARTLADVLLRDFQDPQAGGFFAQTADPEAVGVFANRRKPLRENAVAARFLLELHRLLDHRDTDLPYQAAAKRALLAVSQPKNIKSYGRIIGEYLLALEVFEATPVDITVSGDLSDPTTLELHRAANSLYAPQASIAISPPGERYPDRGKPAVYLCTDTTCSPPIFNPADVGERGQQFLDSLGPKN